jgi:hypothetical protein
VLVSIGKNLFYLLIDSLEFDGLVRELLLYFFRVDEEVLEERPGSLDFSNYDDDLTDRGKRFLPVHDLVLKSGEVTR